MNPLRRGTEGAETVTLPTFAEIADQRIQEAS